MGTKETADRQWLTTEEAAELIRLQPCTIEAWRVRGGGPEFVKFGRAVRYSRAALEEFAARNTRTSTSEAHIEMRSAGPRKRPPNYMGE